MAIYGKRRNGLLSSFAVFQDDESKSKHHQDSLSTEQARRTKSKTNGLKLLNQSRSDDESIDELDGEALLQDVPKQISRVDSLHQEITLSRPNSNRSNKRADDGTERSASPVISSGKKPVEESKARAVLAPKTTNLHLPSDQNASNFKRKTKKPSLPRASSYQAIASRPTTSHTAESLPVTRSTTTNATTLSQKISKLMHQAEAQEAESRVKASILAVELAKPSPRQRAKDALMSASRVLKGKLSNDHKDDSSPPEAIRVYETLDGPRKTKIVPEKGRNGNVARRVAEGTNLSKPKVQSLMGSGSATRRYLPVYESMRSRLERSSLEDDPFHDEPRIDGSISIHDFSGFNFSLDKPKKGTETTKKNELNTDRVINQQTGSLPITQSMPNFTHAISGLDQHSNTMYFSSSPDATSTSSKLFTKQDKVVDQRHESPCQSPSTTNSSLDSQPDDEHPYISTPASKSATDGNQSVKRKSAQRNLRVLDGPAPKRTKTHRQISLEDARSLTEGVNNLGTRDDEQHPWSRSGLKTKSSAQRPKSHGKGLGIFDVGKGKGPEKRVDEEFLMTKNQRPKGFNVRHNSYPRPNSILFGRSSKPAGQGKFMKLDDNDMNVDELG
ncbi:uncharacterized protein KY384_006996 [Bacidia gigantensis]|uniref:uncharacterized protein n=1 Tax=Bacidia gigantensis TaxID=2732470 RepID=UPI001D043B35|nr:uncharacterized protein KY384_006996 [Bacidia gigantensis]KAG8528080.1 hypothetical protein KY384_006996 [Bacidia gigantensis]